MSYGLAYGAPPSYGAGQLQQKARRRRLNIYSPILCVLLPWGFYTAVFSVLCFDLRYLHPSLCLTIAIGLLLLVLFVAFAAQQHQAQRAMGAHNAAAQPSWLAFLAVSLALAWALGVYGGERNYRRYMEPFYRMSNLNTYTDLYTDRTRGETVMDVGVAEFAKGTFLDLQKSGGFKYKGLYCVAPIAVGNRTLALYDFWAVGRDCCGDEQSSQGDFHCRGYNDPHATSGLRLLSDEDKPYYRLAVQQAEATHKIRAAYPIFFEWAVDGATTVEGWRDAGSDTFYWAVMPYFALQFALTGLVGFAFSKLPVE